MRIDAFAVRDAHARFQPARIQIVAVEPDAPYGHARLSVQFLVGSRAEHVARQIIQMLRGVAVGRQLPVAIRAEQPVVGQLQERPVRVGLGIQPERQIVAPRAQAETARIAEQIVELRVGVVGFVAPLVRIHAHRIRRRGQHVVAVDQPALVIERCHRLRRRGKLLLDLEAGRQPRIRAVGFLEVVLPGRPQQVDFLPEQQIVRPASRRRRRRRRGDAGLHAGERIRGEGRRGRRQQDQAGADEVHSAFGASGAFSSSTPSACSSATYFAGLAWTSRTHPPQQT